MSDAVVAGFTFSHPPQTHTHTHTVVYTGMPACVHVTGLLICRQAVGWWREVGWRRGGWAGGKQVMSGRRSQAQRVEDVTEETGGAGGQRASLSRHV